jgi:hypothetical protein
MVNATVDNDPVSIILDGAQSTTVPSNETWRVSIFLATRTGTLMNIDGIGVFQGNGGTASSRGDFLDITLTGGQTIAETDDQPESAILITGFVVSS